MRAPRLAPLAPVVALLLPLAAWAAPGQSELVIVQKGGKEFHRPGCEVIRDGKDVLAMTRAQAEGRKLSQHEGCDPDKQPPETGKPATKPAPPQHVYVDGGRHYHRQDCKRLGEDSKRMTLEDAGRKYWPCTECKPPIRARPK